MPRDDAFDRAVELHRQGNLDRAERLYAGILRDQPGHADALHLLGVIRMSAGDREGRRLIDRAIAIAPKATLYRTNLAELLLRDGHAAQAETEARLALETAPADGKALRVLASVLREQRRYEEACSLLQRALKTDPANVATLVDIGATLNYLGLNELSERYTRMALRGAPETSGLWNNLGLALKGQRRLDEAAQAFRRTAQTPLGRYGLAQTLLLTGCYREAWPLFDARLDFMVYPEPARQRLWRGEDLKGRTLLVDAEQGMGDTIMMSRFLAPLARLDARILVRVPPQLIDLVERTEGCHQMIDSTASVDFDLWLPMMSLPGRMDVDSLSLVPPPAPLALETRPEQRERPRIGLNWRGNPTFRYNNCRSASVETFRPLLARHDIEWLSFFKGENDREEAAALGLPCALADVSDFRQTAERLSSLDLFITVDTAVANLAGSLGVPTIVLLNRDSDWRWLAQGDSTPWYPGAVLVRQDAEGDWAPVIERTIAMVADRLPVTSG